MMPVTLSPVRRLPLVRVLAVGVVLTVLALWLDEPCRAALRGPDGSASQRAAGLISRYSTLEYLLVPALLLLGFGQWRRKRAAIQLGLILFLGSSIAGLTGLTVRCLTGRTRPCALVTQGWYGPWHDGKILIGKFDYNAFPSGHVSAAAGFAGALWLARSKTAWPIWLLPLVVGWGRMKLDRHRLSDVVGGLLVGLVMADVAARWWLGCLEAWLIRRLHRWRGGWPRQDDASPGDSAGSA